MTERIKFGSDERPLHVQIAEEGTDRTFYGVTFVDDSPCLRNYWAGKKSMQFYMYLCSLLTGGNKQSKPMVNIDPALSACLNAKKYFSYSLGDVFLTQKEAVLSALALRKVGTFLFAPVYNLQKAVARPRIWSLSITPIREQGKWHLTGQAVMGACSLWPILPYELLGAVAMCQNIAATATLPFVRMQWMFHCLVLPSKLPDEWVRPDDVPDKLPSASVAAELISAEVKLRNKPMVRPILRSPVTRYDTDFLNTLQSFYAGQANAKAVADDQST